MRLESVGDGHASKKIVQVIRDVYSQGGCV